MKSKNRKPLGLEALEDRWVPATIRFNGGTLFISNPTITAGATKITVTQTAANTFQVKDGVSNNGTYGGVSSISISGTNAADTVTVDLATFAYSGSLTVNPSNGKDTVNLKAAGGSLGGNLTIQVGNGNDTVSLNKTGSTGALTVAGRTQITAGNGTGFGNDQLSVGNGKATTTFLGDFYSTGINSVAISVPGGGDVFRGNLNINLGQNQNPLDLEIAATKTGLGTPGLPPVQVFGSLNVVGGAGNDFMLTGALNVRGNINANLLGGDALIGNDMSLSDVLNSGGTTVNGNVNYNSTAVLDVVDVADSTILGNAIFHMGQGGTSTVVPPPGGTGGPSGVALDNFAATTFIGGNLVETGGNGDFTSTPFSTSGGNDIQATILGSATFQFGNGDNTIGFATASSLGGPLNYTAGNGSNTVSVNAPQLYQLNVHLGNGNNTFNAPNAASSLTGVLVAGNGANTFNDVAPIVPPWFMQGF